MTIIAAMWESSEVILVASDSCSIEMPAEIKSVYNLKLQWHPTAPIAWGIAGNPTIGEWFGEKLKQYEWPPEDLPSFQLEVAANLSKWNGEQRKLITLAGAETAESDLSDVLVVGYLDTTFLFTVDERGVITNYEQEHGFHAIGSGGPPAIMVHAALSHLSSYRPEQNLLNYIMEVAVSKALRCSLPIHILRVSKSCVDKVEIQQAKAQPPNTGSASVNDN